MRLLWSSVLSLLLGSTLPAQTRTIAERLGYPANAKLLTLHADDLGATHSIDAPSFDALDKGTLSSASIMMATPWITEVAAYAKAHPDAGCCQAVGIVSAHSRYNALIRRLVSFERAAECVRR